MKKIKLSIVLATRNEEENITRCLASIKSIADEIIIFDEESEDNTVPLAKKFGAKIFSVKHEPIFHKTKQKAIDKAKGSWILQLDADEVVTPQLAKEIQEVVKMPDKKLHELKVQNLHFSKLFERHQNLIEKRDGKIGKQTGEVVAFFIPRVNIFMGKPLIHGGVYPDPAIRLIKRGKARLPAKDVHEIMAVDGEVGWLVNYMEHHDSPTFSRYIWRNNRYTDLIAQDYKKEKLPKNILYFLFYTVYMPLYTFSDLFFRHKGFLDGYRGLIWSFFSSLRFPVSYIKYFSLDKN